MDDMARRFAPRGVTSVFIYTREAHPGENYPHHTSIEGKRAHARALQSHTGLSRRVLVDDLEGTVHRAFGGLPNMTWIIGRNIVLYRAEWTLPADIENALEHALNALDNRRELRPVYSERLAWRKDTPDAFRRGLELAGPQAVSDFYGSKNTRA